MYLLMNRAITLFLAVLLFAPLVKADDTDIYLKSNSALSNPPFLSLLLDVRSPLFAKMEGCDGNNVNPLTCIDRFSESAFATLCVSKMFPATTTLSTASRDRICRVFYKDYKDDGLFDHKF